MKLLKNQKTFDNRSGCFVALIVACGAVFHLLYILAIAYLIVTTYLIWSILLMYFRMKSFR